MARKRRGQPVHGWLALDKPVGVSSARAVAVVRRLFDAEKAGHGGTLDPLASGILPVALLTMGAIRAIPSVYLRSAQTLHLSPWQTITTVLLPAALPEVFTGLRIGFSVTLLGVLLGEMFASKLGLGSMIMADMSLAQSEDMVTVAIILFAFAAAANAALIWIEHRLHRKA